MTTLDFAWLQELAEKAERESRRKLLDQASLRVKIGNGKSLVPLPSACAAVAGAWRLLKERQDRTRRCEATNNAAHIDS